MPNFTPNLNLEKPLQSEFYNVDVTNDNMDKIDSNVANLTASFTEHIQRTGFALFNGDVRDVNYNASLYCVGATLNVPYNSAWYVDVEVHPSTPDTVRKIVARRYLNGEVWVMNLVNGVWNEWERVETGAISNNHYVTATGTNNLTANFTGVPLTAGVHLTFKNTTTNTGNVTLNLNGMGAKPIVKNGAVQLGSGAIIAGGVYTVVYDGTNFILNEGGGEVGLRNVQRGSFVWNNSTNERDITLPSFDVSRAYLKFNFTTAQTSAYYGLVSGYVKDSTTISFSRNHNDGNRTVTVDWELIEFSGEVAVQSGVIYGNNQAVQNVTISSVNRNRSFIELSIISSDTNTPTGLTALASGSLTSNTNLALRGGTAAAGYEYSIRWQVVTFK